MIDKNYDANGSEVLDSEFSIKNRKTAEQIAEEHMIFSEALRIISLPDDGIPRNRIIVCESVDLDNIVENLMHHREDVWRDLKYTHKTISRLSKNERELFMDDSRKKGMTVYTITAIDKTDHRVFVEDFTEAVSAQYQTIVFLKIHSI